MKFRNSYHIQDEFAVTAFQPRVFQTREIIAVDGRQFLEPFLLNKCSRTKQRQDVNFNSDTNSGRPMRPSRKDRLPNTARLLMLTV